MWRVLVTRDVLRALERMGLLERFRRLMGDVVRSLEGDPSYLGRLLREPVVMEVAGRGVRRIRMGDFRVFVIIEPEERVIRVIGVRHRRAAYRR